MYILDNNLILSIQCILYIMIQFTIFYNISDNDCILGQGSCQSVALGGSAITVASQGACSDA